MAELLRDFTAYVQQLTGLTAKAVPWAGSALPAFLQQRYTPHPVQVAGRTWLAVQLDQPEPPAPLQLRMQLDQLAERMHPPPAGVCLVAEHLPPYVRSRLIELRQPFVIPGRQLFWPALGSVETVQRPQRLRPRPVQQLSPVAQQLLIAMLLRRLPPPIIISEAAAALGCTAASISQAVKALEGSGLVRSQAQGRERSFELLGDPRETWLLAQPLLRNPMRTQVRVREAELTDGPSVTAGEYALADRTELAHPAERSYAVTSRTWAKQRTGAVIPTPDTGTCLLELWRYSPTLTAERGAVDPLSLYLSLRERKDERVQVALEQMMEQHPW
jgi:hypothetical protein